MSDDAQESNSFYVKYFKCEVCMQYFASTQDFVAHHVDQFGKIYNCCVCDLRFESDNELYDHCKVHKDVEVESDYTFTENDPAVLNTPYESLTEGEQLVYLFDDSKCVNEVVIEENDEIIEAEPEDTLVTTPENYTNVQVEHGYMSPSVFKKQSQNNTKRYSTSEKGGSSIVKDESKTECQEVPAAQLKVPDAIPEAIPKRWISVPDFSATTFQVLNPTEEIEIVHYKCLRCEKLYINKMGFYRHIEMGKCYTNSCDVCCSTFSKNSEFFNHYITEHTDRAICKFCFQTLMYKNQIYDHMRRHLNQFRHRCMECDKGFYTITEYNNHYRDRHMKIKHLCDVCGRFLTGKYYFNRHVATHRKKNNSLEIEYGGSISNMDMNTE